MNGTEKADLFLKELKADSAEYKELETRGLSLGEKKNVIRSLMNIRMPGELSGAIVNAANSQMLGCFVPCHRCIDNAIHSAAGMQLREECNRIMKHRRLRYGINYEEPTGTATLTHSYNLPCDHVIHTVGPIVYGRLTDALCQDLQNCYENVLNCCLEHDIKSVAFCCISTGEFHFPNDRTATGLFMRKFWVDRFLTRAKEIMIYQPVFAWVLVMHILPFH